MSEVIRFLEAQGRQPARSNAEFAGAVAGLAIDDAQRAALMRRNSRELSDLLGGRAAMRGFIMTPD